MKRCKLCPDDESTCYCYDDKPKSFDIPEIKEALEKGYDKDSNVMLHYQSKIRRNAYEWLQGLVEEIERLKHQLFDTSYELGKRKRALEKKHTKCNELAEAFRKADEELVKIYSLIERKHYDEDCLKAIEYVGITIIREALSKHGLSE